MLFPTSDIRELAAQGLTMQQAADRMGIKYCTLYSRARAYGIKFKHAKRGLPARGPIDRNERIVGMYRQGLTLAKIGESFGLSRERVRQVLKKAGVTRADGGMRVCTASKHAARNVDRDATCLTRYGMTHAEVAPWRRNGTVAVFRRQRQNAWNRGIDWSLSFAQWLSIWLASGKLAQRGRNAGQYVMSRIKDSGGYEIGNVHVQLCEDNGREAVKKWRGVTKANRGVYHLYPGLAKPWLASIGGMSGTRIGFFATEEEAAEARLTYLAANGYYVNRSGCAQKAA
jgi:hypothetical protein